MICIKRDEFAAQSNRNKNKSNLAREIKKQEVNMMLSSTVDLVSKREQVIERMKKGKFRAMKGSQVLLAKLNTQRGHYMNDQCEEEEETGESMTSREPDLRDIVNKQQVMFRILNEENLFLIEKNQEYEQELHEKEAELQSARKELQR